MDPMGYVLLQKNPPGLYTWPTFVGPSPTLHGLMSWEARKIDDLNDMNQSTNMRNNRWLRHCYTCKLIWYYFNYVDVLLFLVELKKTCFFGRYLEVTFCLVHKRELLDFQTAKLLYVSLLTHGFCVNKFGLNSSWQTWIPESRWRPRYVPFEFN